MKIAIGIICYNESSAPYLPFLFASLSEQAGVDFTLYIADNSEEEANANKPSLATCALPYKYYWMGGNLGFAKAYNRLIETAIKDNCDYFFVLNPDTFLEKNTLSLLIDRLEADENLAAVSPLVLTWDFANQKKTDLVDTCGISLRRTLRFFDLGQGLKRSDLPAELSIIGPSGAAGLFRLKDLAFLKDAFGYFDERMFMYKEDCDLAYRLYLSGRKCVCVKEALMFHDRSLAKDWQNPIDRLRSRKKRSRRLRTWSFLNQQLIFVKHWRGLPLGGKISVLLYQLSILPYILFFEPFLIYELFKVRLSWCKKLT